MSTISRRAFLKTVGVGALSVAAMSVLAGCEFNPGTTGTETTTAIPAEFGRDYNIGEYDVKVTAPTATSTSYDNTWLTNFKSELTDDDFGTEMELDADTRVVTWVESYSEDNTAEEKALLLAKCKSTANAAAKVELVTITASIFNRSENDVALASYASEAYTAAAVANGTKTVKSNSTVFTASCNGTALPCAVGTSFLDTTATTADSVKVYVAAPANTKEFTLKVVMPGAETALEYTIENPSYLDLSKL